MSRVGRLLSVQPISLRIGELHNIFGLKEQHVSLCHKVVLGKTQVPHRIDKTLEKSGTNNREVVECTKPARDRYKYNIDASFSSSSNMVGIGICLRNDSGVFVLAKTNYFSPLCDVDVGEAVSLHTSLQWMVALRFVNVDFALNSKIVVDHFKLDIVDHSKFGCIISTCRQLFIDSLQNSRVEFNRSQAN
ncbi:hypothetical protein MTR_1g088650 [Medicago truncatula]|uniref:RNase H type-1 domain-containing protein n=1 Tax=Medicago truncatula TaxID=3880 RepID=G7IF75_MEDTR|nr:hypothetical protein MTR_1g088650 [Medicago truncatula]